jgi:hypothetical protein
VIFIHSLIITHVRILICFYDLNRVKKIRMLRQRIRQLHGHKVMCVMRVCPKCGQNYESGEHEPKITGRCQFNGHDINKSADRIIDYDSKFDFAIVAIDLMSYEKCGKGCKGKIKNMSEIRKEDIFVADFLEDNRVEPEDRQLWEVALKRRRTSGLSLNFYEKVYAHKDMPKMPIEAVKAAIGKCEGESSFLYKALFDPTGKKEENIATGLVECYQRMDTVCSSNAGAYWFKFWITACKALFPDSNNVPKRMWNFDFLANREALPYTVSTYLFFCRSTLTWVFCMQIHSDPDSLSFMFVLVIA